MNGFLHTLGQQLSLLDMPTTLPDVFEFFMCDMNPLSDTDSTLWRFLRCLQLQDILVLRQLCKSSHQLVPPYVQLLAIKMGGMLGDLRVAFWQA